MHLMLCFNACTGHFLLTHLLLPKLKSSGGCRIINASAVAYQIAEPDLDDLPFTQKEYKPGDAYAQSKLCIMWWTRHLAKQLEGMHPTCLVFTGQEEGS